jgi:predicted SAM-dependent methyltransferase
MLNNEELLYDYLEKHEKRGLQIGSGTNPLSDFLNSDLVRTAPNILQLDATKPFQIPNDTFDYVYSEHVIEHISFRDGMFMLRECHRILRPGGIIRLITPSLRFLIRIFSSTRSETEEAYLNWCMNHTTHWAPKPLPGFLFNVFVRAWGHQFIYDEDTMRLALEIAGFDPINQGEILESQHAMLRSRENVTRMPPGFLRLESMVFEAAKPSGK